MLLASGFTYLFPLNDYKLNKRSSEINGPENADINTERSSMKINVIYPYLYLIYLATNKYNTDVV